MDNIYHSEHFQATPKGIQEFEEMQAYGEVYDSSRISYWLSLFHMKIKYLISLKLDKLMIFRIGIIFTCLLQLSVAARKMIINQETLKENVYN